MRDAGTVRIFSTALLVLLLMQSGWADDKGGISKIVERGKWLVMVGGCADCHSPKVFGPEGPMPDTTRFLSGSPAGTKVPDIPFDAMGPDKWGALTTPDLTVWAGPWGVSFTMNLTPDVATGLGSWTPEMFMKALRTGKHMGEGRPILPPMPWPAIGQLKESDLRAIFAYLRTLKPIANAIHEPIAPPAMHAPGGGNGKQ